MDKPYRLFSIVFYPPGLIPLTGWGGSKLADEECTAHGSGPRNMGCVRIILRPLRPLEVNNMSEEIQRVIDRGILKEDSDGLLWLTEEAKSIANNINDDEVLMALLEKATDEDARVGFWTMVFMACCTSATQEEVNEGVRVLLGWLLGVKETRLDEWSMGLRLR